MEILELKKEIRESAEINGVYLSRISENKEAYPGLRNKYYIVETTAKEQSSAIKSLLITVGLVKKPVEVGLTSIIYDATKKEFMLIYPSSDFENLFEKFLNDLEKKG